MKSLHGNKYGSKKSEELKRLNQEFRLKYNRNDQILRWIPEFEEFPSQFGLVSGREFVEKLKQSFKEKKDKDMIIERRTYIGKAFITLVELK